MPLILAVRRLYLEAKLQAEPAALVPLVALALTSMGIWSWATNLGHIHRTRDVLLVLEVALPAVLVLLMSSALSADSSALFEPLLLSYPSRALGWAIWRATPVVVVVAAVSVCIGAVADAVYMHLDANRLFSMIFPTALALSGLTAFGNLLTRVMHGGVILPLGYWALDLVTKGVFTRKLYLFEGSYPSPLATVDDKAWLALVGALSWVCAVCLKRWASARR